MRAPFFDSPEKIDRLGRVAESWLGTPFMPNARIKGAGVSCQKLVCEIYRETGAVAPDFEAEDGPMDWSRVQHRSLIADFMQRHAGIFLEVKNLQPGDMAGFLIGGCIHHCGVVLTPELKFIHCFRGHGVALASLRDATYATRLERIWRPMQ